MEFLHNNEKYRIEIKDNEMFFWRCPSKPSEDNLASFGGRFTIKSNGELEADLEIWTIPFCINATKFTKIFHNIKNNKPLNKVQQLSLMMYNRELAAVVRSFYRTSNGQ